MGSWNTNLDHFDQFLASWRHHGRQIYIISKTDVRNKPLTKKLHQILISIFLSLSIHDTQLWVLFNQFGDNGVTKEIFQNFERWNKELDLML